MQALTELVELLKKMCIGRTVLSNCNMGRDPHSCKRAGTPADAKTKDPTLATKEICRLCTKSCLAAVQKQTKNEKQIASVERNGNASDSR